MRSSGRRLVGRGLVEAPCNFAAGRPRAALLFGFFCDFRCGMLLFMVVLVACENKKWVKMVVKC